jgi:hypothetical protein
MSPRLAGRAAGELGRHPVEHAAVDGVGVLFPAEHAHRRDAVERDVVQRGECLVPVDVAVADLVVLVVEGVLGFQRLVGYRCQKNQSARGDSSRCS